MTNTMNIGSEWNRNLSSNSMGATTTSNALRKIPLAEYRYGKEEMISLHTDNPPYPIHISKIPTIVRQNVIQPLAFVPLTEEEQVALTGNVNSGSVYSGRGRGGYYRGGGGRGRGRRGRTDYHRSTSGGEEFPERGGYYRSNSDSTWNEDGRASYQTRGGGRALRDSNWRAGTQTLGEVNEDHGKDRSKDGGDRKDHWNPLPEWATDDPKKSVGGFDNKGRFSASDQDLDTVNVNEDNNTDDNRKSGSDSPEDVFEKETDGGGTTTDRPTPSSVGDQLGEFTTDPPVIETRNKIEWPLQEHTTGRVKENRIESVDSVEEMQRRFEKAAEAVLSTEDEDTPSPSPNLIVPPQQQQVQQQSLPSTVNDMQRWLYKDPRGDLQGPFTNSEMSDWFAAGYFTMDLCVRRLCDAKFLPLGQILRIWGRIPFSPGPQPPPLQQTEPFWQQMFNHQRHLFPQTADSSTNVSANQQHHQQATPTVKPTSSTNNDVSPIWGLSRMSPEEEQWPDLTGEEPPPSQSSNLPLQEDVARQKMKMAAEEEERRRVELKLEEEIARKIEEDRQREAERKRKEEEDMRRREEERRRAAMEEEKQRKRAAAERRQREEQERQRIEQMEKEKERERIEMERRKEWEEEMQRRKLQQQQQREEEERRLNEELKLQKLNLHEQSTATSRLVSTESSSDSRGVEPSLGRVWTFDKKSAPSLVQIQQEEKKREKVRYEERQQQLLLQQNYEQQLAAANQSASWNSPTTPHSKPLSFLEIQHEQERQFTVRDSSSGSSSSTNTSRKTINAPPTQSSWSKIAATNKVAPPSLHQTVPPPHWGSHHQPPPTSNPPPTYSKPSHQASPQKDNQPLSFWEECALVTNNTSSSTSGSNTVSKPSAGKGKNKDNGGAGKSTSKGTVKKKEEDKVRQLFTYSTTDDPFTDWCAAELVKFNTDVDAATFVSLLLEVDSTYEVHDYIKSFLGETDDVHSFAKQFLEKRQKLRNLGKKSSSNPGGSSDSASLPGGGGTSSSSSRSGKKKKKGKMQKMPPSALLGFTVNAAERPNAGEIHSIKDAL